MTICPRRSNFFEGRGAGGSGAAGVVAPRKGAGNDRNKEIRKKVPAGRLTFVKHPG